MTVPLLIARKLRRPIVSSRTGDSAFPARGMLVPETTVHEDDLPEAWKDEVGFSGQVLPMESKPEAHPVN
jgi:hypothetical protein